MLISLCRVCDGVLNLIDSPLGMLSVSVVYTFVNVSGGQIVSTVMCIMDWHGLLLSIMNWWLGVQQKGEIHTNVVYEYLLYLGDKYYNWQRTSFLGFLDHVFLEQVLSISLARFLYSGFFDQVRPFTKQLHTLLPHSILPYLRYLWLILDKLSHPLAKPWAELVHLVQKKRPIYAGNALCTVRYTGVDPCMLTIRSTSFPVPHISSDSKWDAAPVSQVDISTYSEDTLGKSRYLKHTSQDTERPDLGSARAVVTGSRALKSPENFRLLEKLAEKLGAAGLIDSCSSFSRANILSLLQASTVQSAVDLNIPSQIAVVAFSIVQLVGITAVMSQVAWQVFAIFVPVIGTCIWYQ
ncbi:hypothetical protein IFM89_029886, partial [Coptis chinensis]